MGALNLFRLLVAVPPIVIVAAVILQPFVDPRLLVLDPMVAAEVSGVCCQTYYGIVSTLGVFAWIATAVICAFAFWILRRMNAPGRSQIFALVAALFTAWLGFDDAFLLHENLFPKLGVSQTLILCSYVGLATIYGFALLAGTMRPDLVLFALSAIGLGGSLVIDLVLHSTDSMIVAMEDGLKFVGICCWFGFHALLMVEAVIEAMQAPQSGRALMPARLGAIQVEPAP